MPHTPPPHIRIPKLEDQEGQTFVEYALLVSLIAILVIVAFPAFVTSLQGVFSAVSSAL